jgi:thiol-disulfide isomerase/thioredoxin
MRLLFSAAFCLLLSLSVFGQYNFKQSGAVDFTATDMSGRSYHLADNKGKIVLLTFWSSRCPACKSVIPKLNNMSKKYAGQNVVFLGLTAENETSAGAFLRKNPFDFSVIPNSFGILLQLAEKDSNGNLNFGYPAYFLINQQGEVEMRASGSGKTGKIDERIGALLNSR